MDTDTLYALIRDIAAGLSVRDSGIAPLPERPDRGMLLSEAGLDLAALPDLLAELKRRLGNRDLGLDGLLEPTRINALTVGNLLESLQASLQARSGQPIVVYVDDEIQNLFVFNRRYGKQLNLMTFTDPEEALAFIKAEDRVGLVITDEVMPRMSGNRLCDEVRKVKPRMKFVLITGNPDNDDDLMYRSLRRNRFYEFLNKPLDLDGKGEEYLALIEGLLAYDW